MVKKLIRKFVWNLIYKWQFMNFPMPEGKGHFVEIWLFQKKIFGFKISNKKVMWLEDKFDLELF